MERRVFEWLFAPGAWAVMATLFFFSSLVVYFLPMTADEKFGTIRGVVLVLVVLHFFMARCEVLLLLLDWLLATLLSISLYFLSVVIFVAVCHVLLGTATDATWLQLAARMVFMGRCAFCSQAWRRGCVSLENSLAVVVYDAAIGRSTAGPP